MSGPLSSALPRPRTMPSLTTASKGGNVQLLETGTTSPCTTSPRTGASGGPASSISATGPVSLKVKPSSFAVRSSHAFWSTNACVFPA